MAPYVKYFNEKSYLYTLDNLTPSFIVTSSETEHEPLTNIHMAIILLEIVPLNNSI